MQFRGDDERPARHEPTRPAAVQIDRVPRDARVQAIEQRIGDEQFIAAPVEEEAKPRGQRAATQELGVFQQRIRIESLHRRQRPPDLVNTARQCRTIENIGHRPLQAGDAQLGA